MDNKQIEKSFEAENYSKSPFLYTRIERSSKTPALVRWILKNTFLSSERLVVWLLVFISLFFFLATAAIIFASGTRFRHNLPMNINFGCPMISPMSAGAPL